MGVKLKEDKTDFKFPTLGIYFFSYWKAFMWISDIQLLMPST